jgi:hypothetical protein
VVEEAVPPPTEDAAPPPEAPFDDPFVRGFVRASVHLKRYLPFYIGAAVWALTMLLIQPLGGGKSDVASVSGPGFAGQAVPAATVSDDTAVADLGADAIAAPTFEAVTGASFSDTSVEFEDLSGSTDSEFAGSDTSSSTSGSDFSSTDTTISFDDSEFDTPKQLTITKSGYSSVTGGTPLEQPPANNALPVASTAGKDSKRSYFSLTGEGTLLMLKQTPDGNVQPETAVIKICKVTVDWKAERGSKLDPNVQEYDPSCSTGSVLDGVWSFDLSGFSEADRESGLTITPGAGTALTFQVNFDPFPEPSEGA